MREPGYIHKEDFDTGSRAAAAGGVTTVMVMPTTNPATTTPDYFEEKIRSATGRAYVDFAIQAGIVENPSHIETLASLGAVSFELFLADVPPHLLTQDNGNLIDALSRIGRVGRVAGITPGDDAVVRWKTTQLAKGNNDVLAFARSRPPVAEALGVARACMLAEETGCRVHIRQVSCVRSLEVIRHARNRYKQITAEVTPHHLVLTEESLEQYGPFVKMLPPLRTSTDTESLWQALKDGTIDIVATDHAPHLQEEKEQGKTNIWKAPSGIPGLQTILPLMLDQVAKGCLTFVDLARLCSENPARIFGLFPRKGTLEPGSDADLVIVDPSRTMVIENMAQYSKAVITPFHGQRILGYPVLCMMRGHVIMCDGKIEGNPHGAFVAPRSGSPTAS
jgi:dihydroorotase